MRFPYGLCDFNKIITKGYFYCDRTDRIAMLENTGDYLLLLRPRRFGKSLLLSMLENYYDIARKDRFQELFGHLLIGKNPTSSHNQYFILKWDFSCIDPSGSATDIKRAFYDHINACIKAFMSDYEDYLSREIEVDPQNAINSIKSLLSVTRKSGHLVYLLIDEYDNFANEIMMGVRRKKKIFMKPLFMGKGR